MNRLMTALCTFFLASTTWAFTPIHYNQKQLFKNWALSGCLAKGLKTEDAEAASGGYFEFGNASAEAYQEGSKLIDHYLAKAYASKSGVPLHTMECIDLFYSKSLDNLTRKYIH
jgi:hypothetical protein